MFGPIICLDLSHEKWENIIDGTVFYIFPSPVVFYINRATINYLTANLKNSSPFFYTSTSYMPLEVQSDCTTEGLTSIHIEIVFGAN